jgi:hypothetical protein
MKEEIEKHSVKVLIEKYALNSIKHQELDKDSRFTFLRDQLLIQYRKLYLSTENTSDNLKSTINKNLICSLQELLLETVFTPKLEDQLMMLDKVYKWFTSKTNQFPVRPIQPLAQIQELPRLELRSRNKSLPFVVTSKSPQIRNIPLTFPKRSKKKSKDDIIAGIESRYFSMLNNEKIELRTTENRRSNAPIRPKTPMLLEEPIEDTNQFSKKPSKTPDLEIFSEENMRTPSIDFRTFNLKFRNMSGIDKTKIFNGPSIKDLQQVQSMKGKLAKMKVKANVKEIESAEVFQRTIQDDEVFLKNLPIGGEMLLRKPKKKKKSSMKSTKMSGFFN